MSTTTEISSNNDTIDIRDLIERVEELESLFETTEDDMSQEEKLELEQLTTLLDELKGRGGDHDYRGSWYPLTLINESYFTEYAQELAREIGLIENNVSWPYTCIDWDQAADELLMDYSSVEFNNTTFYFR